MAAPNSNLANTTSGNAEASSTKEISSSTSQLQNTIKEVDEDERVDDTSKQREIELEEERKLKARHPCIQRPGSEFLQKRLQRGQKYFDSGDYNMAKASTNPNVKLPDGTTPKPAIDSKLLNKRH